MLEAQPGHKGRIIIAGEGVPMTTHSEKGEIPRVEVGREVQLRELLVFLLLIVPSMVLSFFAVRLGTLSFVLTAYATIFRDIGLVCLVVYFLWRNKEEVSRIGWVWKGRLWGDVFVGVVLFGVMFLGAGLLEEGLRAANVSRPSTPMPSFLAARGAAQFVLAGVLVVIVAIAEETVFRGYLMLRLNAVTRRSAAAVILSSIIFALGHGYEGTAGVATVGYMGLFFALVYMWRRSLIAPIIMHFLQDFIAVVVLPLSGTR
jgi:membrane protease YdiL (CAAX protease family)